MYIKKKYEVYHAKQVEHSFILIVDVFTEGNDVKMTYLVKLNRPLWIIKRTNSKRER